MAKKSSGLSPLITFVAWLTGVIVSLSVGFALIDGVLGLPAWLGGNTVVPAVAGWIVVITVIVGVIVAIGNRLK